MMDESTRTRIRFEVTDVNDGRVYDCHIDKYPNGAVTIWIPYGVRASAEDVGRIIEHLKST
jgi:hypothetical protein